MSVREPKIAVMWQLTIKANIDIVGVTKLTYSQFSTSGCGKGGTFTLKGADKAKSKKAHF